MTFVLEFSVTSHFNNVLLTIPQISIEIKLNLLVMTSDRGAAINIEAPNLFLFRQRNVI